MSSEQITPATRAYVRTTARPRFQPRFIGVIIHRQRFVVSTPDDNRTQ